jgi:hypothetical protein
MFIYIYISRMHEPAESFYGVKMKIATISTTLWVRAAVARTDKVVRTVAFHIFYTQEKSAGSWVLRIVNGDDNGNNDNDDDYGYDTNDIDNDDVSSSLSILSLS